MKATKFKTNVKCSGCIATVTPFLNEAVGENTWQVDLQDPARVLTVNADVPADKVINALEKAGYRAEKL